VASDPKRERNIVESGKVIEKAKILEYDADTPSDRRTRASSCHGEIEAK
jgi:hypothetical protein